MQRAIADACLGGAEAGAAIASDLRAFLEARGVGPEDVAAILAAPRRLAVYRSLVRNGLSSVVARILPRTRARLNRVCAGRFDADFAAFVAERGPRTHYLRDVPFELFAWARPRWEADATIPGYLVDLASYELATFEVSTAGRNPDDNDRIVEVAPDRPLAFHESVRVLRYGWAVHELPADDAAAEEPAHGEVRLLAYRDAEHTVRWLELSPLAAALLERLTAGETLGAAIEGSAAQASVREDVARLLADLGTRGALLGARAR
jgi:hypothetical protein